MISNAEVVQMWGEAGLHRYEPEALRPLDLPTETKTILSDLGLPRVVEPFFVADGDDAHLLTLSEYAQQVGIVPLTGWDQYYRVGGNAVSAICLTRRVGQVYCVDPDGQLPDCFVNSSVEHFIACLYFMAKQRNEISDEDYATLAQRGFEAEEAIARIDPPALSDGDNYWAQIIEELKFALL